MGKDGGHVVTGPQGGVKHPRNLQWCLDILVDPSYKIRIDSGLPGLLAHRKICAECASLFSRRNHTQMPKD